MGKVDAMQRIETELRALGVSEPEWEYRFHPTRRWRFDLAWPAERIAIEVDGGTWVGGRHTSGAGFAKDCEKLNCATLLGWQVYRFTTTMIRDGAATATLQAAFAERSKG